ncbi:MAG: nucleoside phosphorylase [Thermoplasmataceae archaeon]
MARISPRRFPKYSRKHAEHPLFTASEFTAGMPHSPENVIFVYSNNLAEMIAQDLGLEPIDQPYGQKIFVRNFSDSNRSIYLMMPGAGAPMTATVADELHSMGAMNFLILGIAGSLSPKLKVNDIVLCRKAVRDEGVSHHILPPALYDYPSPDLVAHIRTGMRNSGIKFTAGPTWTVDFPYAETAEELKEYRSLGVLTVEMEAAALFAVGKARRFRTAAVFTISDILDEEKWSGMQNPIEGMRQLTRVARIFSQFHE